METIQIVTETEPIAEYAVLVPTNYNNGDPVPQSVNDALENRLLDTFGGYTYDGHHTGAWRDPEDGKTYYDQTVRYLIATDRPTEVVRFAEHVAAVLDQQSVYVRYPDNTVRFVERAAIAAD